MAGKLYSAFEAKHLDKLPRDSGMVKLIIDTKKEKPFYVVNPAKTYHVFAAAQYLGKKSINELTTANAGHIVGAVIQISDLDFRVGCSSLELGDMHIRHEKGQLRTATAIVQAVIKIYREHAAAELAAVR